MSERPRSPEEFMELSDEDLIEVKPENVEIEVGLAKQVVDQAPPVPTEKISTLTGEPDFEGKDTAEELLKEIAFHAPSGEIPKSTLEAAAMQAKEKKREQDDDWEATMEAARLAVEQATKKERSVDNENDADKAA
ncbi:MAG: hypothetical protein V1738_00980 [Patescibacteria group bacterium]